MSWDKKDKLQRDERFGALLRDSAGPCELFSWRQIESIVAAAPPARLPWYAPLFRSPAPLRYSLAPLMLLLVATGMLWVMPAQSEQVGTMVYTSLPTGWERFDSQANSLGVDPERFAEVQAAAQREFAALDLPQGSLRIFVAERAGRDQLVLTMLEAQREQAAGVMQRLNARYPMLAAFPQEYVNMEADQSGSRLMQLVERVQHGASAGLDETQVTQQVLGALHGAGLDHLDVSYDQQADGSLVVTIEGEFSMQVAGHTQEELAPQAGGAANGKADAGQLLQLLGAAQK